MLSARCGVGFLSRRCRDVATLALDRLFCARRKDSPLSRTDNDRDPHPNRGDSDKNKRCVEKVFRYRCRKTYAHSLLMVNLLLGGFELSGGRTSVPPLR